MAQAALGHGHDGDGAKPRTVEIMEGGKEIRGSLGQIAGRAEVDGLGGARERLGTECQQGFAAVHAFGIEAQRQSGGVVAGQHARRPWRVVFVGPCQGSKDCLQVLLGQTARAQQPGARPGEIEHCRFETDPAGPAVEHGGDLLAES